MQFLKKLMKIQMIVLSLSMVTDVLSQQKFPQMKGITPKSEAQPCLSPDGNWVLFSSGEGFAKNLFKLHMKTKEVITITENREEDSHARWSPNGKMIVFQREDTLGNRDLWIVDYDGRNERNITNTKEYGEQHPRFSNDNKHVIFDSNRDEKNVSSESQNYEIYGLELSTKKVTRLTNWDYWDMYPSFSPDGSHIAWRRTIEGDNSESPNFEIFVRNLNSGKEWNLSNHESYDSNPHWSPSGDQIVFTSNRSGSYNLYLAKSDGSSLRQITQAEGRSIGFGIPSFSFDGTRILANRYTLNVADMIMIELNEQE